MTYFNYSEEEKSKMFIEYHKKLVEKFYGNGENLFIVWLLKLPCYPVYDFCCFSYTFF